MNPSYDPDPPCNTIAYRTIRRRTWFDPDDETRIKADAFMRRPPREKKDGTIDPGDADGLSLSDSFHINLRQCIQRELSCYGVVSLHVGWLRKLGLTVVRDPDDPAHLLVPNMPLENPNDKDQEALLDQVAGQARIVNREKWQRS